MFGQKFVRISSDGEKEFNESGHNSWMIWRSPTITGEIYNPLFGNTSRAIKRQYAFITAAEYGLEFGGSPGNVSDFTVGAFLNLDTYENYGNCIWTVSLLDNPTSLKLVSGGTSSDKRQRKCCYYLRFSSFPRAFRFRYNKDDVENDLTTNGLQSSGWAHFAITYDKESIRIFLNGSQINYLLTPNWNLNGLRSVLFDLLHLFQLPI